MSPAMYLKCDPLSSPIALPKLIPEATAPTLPQLSNAPRPPAPATP